MKMGKDEKLNQSEKVEKDMANTTGIQEKSGYELAKLTKEERSAWLDEQRNQAIQWVKDFNFPTEYRPGHQLVDLYRAHDEVGSVHIQRRVEESGMWEDIVVFERDRNANFAVPFRPFRQLQDGEWKHFAFVAPGRRSFVVIDLSDGSIVAKPEGYGQFVDGFWTHDFKPSYAEHDSSLLACLEDEGTNWEEYRDGPLAYFDMEDVWELDPLDAKFALVSAVMPGYGELFSAQYIDLTKLVDGEIAIDSRFGYHGDLPEGMDIMDAVSFSFGRFHFLVPHTFEISGSLVWPK